MAGTLLFLNKKLNISGQYINYKKRLKNAITEHYNHYFHQINILQDNEHCLLIQFRKDNVDKYFSNVDGSWLIFEGAVFSLTETKILSAQDIWTLYKKYGKQFVNFLDGHFVIKIFDSESSTYFIVNDYIRNKTNYILNEKDYLLITPYLLLAACIKEPKVDYYAMNEFFWRYYILSDRTMMDGVERLKQSSIYSISNQENLKRDEYWKFPNKAASLSFNQAVEKSIDSIKETARLLYNSFGENVCDLTLGQDSRLLVTSYLKQDLPVTTNTFGEDHFFEVAKVKIMAKKYNIKHYNIKLSPQYTENNFDYFKRGVFLGSLDEPGYLIGRILYMREEQHKYGQALINGSGGPFYKDCFWEEQYFLNLYREPKKINLEHFLKLRVMNKNYPDTIFNDVFKSIKNEAAEYFTNMLYNEIKGYESCPVSMQIDKFALFQWHNYGTCANSVGNSLFNAFSPLLFRRNLETVINLPAKWRWNKSKFQREIMYRISPELAKEKTDFGGINMVPKNFITFLPFYSRYLYQQSSRFRNKIKNKLKLSVTTRLQEAWNYSPIYKILYESENIQALVKYDKMVLSEIVNKNEWQTLINVFHSSDAIHQNQYEYLFKILSIELFFKAAENIWKAE